MYYIIIIIIVIVATITKDIQTALRKANVNDIYKYQRQCENRSR